MQIKILVTGANGFLGSVIVRNALEAGFNVFATDLGKVARVQESNYFSADILDPQKFVSNLSKTDVIIHAAGMAHVFDALAQDPNLFRKVNATGAANVARAAVEAGVGHFILVSSVSVYGGSRNGGGEASGCYPIGPYAESKYEGENLVADIAVKAGMKLTILRMATLYGEGDPGNVARLMRAIDLGRFIWIGNGMNRKSLLHKEDAARASLEVAKTPASGIQVYNVAAIPSSMREVVENLAEALGKRIPGITVPASLAGGIASMFSKLPWDRTESLGMTLKKWLADDVYDGEKFNRTFNFKAKVDLKEGLRQEVFWYRNEREKK